MSATVLAQPDTQPTRLSALRIGLVAIAVVILLAASFVIGRATGSNAQSTSSHPTNPAGVTATTAAAPAPSSGAPVTVCHMGRAC